MIYYYAIKQMYELDKPELDDEVLDLFREKWAPMVASRWQCPWKAFSGGSKTHIYGTYPGYFLSAYVLGVRRVAPAADKTITIEPHLGNLDSAEGVVATAFGPVSISWKRGDAALNFSVEIPPGVNARLLLPINLGKKCSRSMARPSKFPPSRNGRQQK